MFDDDVSPQGSVFGPGEPGAAIVGSVHGDEPTGVRAIHRVVEATPAFERAVQFLVANPPAAVAHRRYLDADMNRSFPGDEDADARERRLAAELLSMTEGRDVLSIHTTHATPDPIAFVTSGHPRSIELASRLPLDYVVNERPVVDSAYTSAAGVVSVEAGKPEHHDATEKAVTLIRAFLRVTGAVGADGAADATGGAAGTASGDRTVATNGAPTAESGPDRATGTGPTFYTIYDTVEKPPGDDTYELLVENFERIEAGEAYARAGDETFVADEPFVPVLLSEAGYPEIFGYKGRQVAESIEGARAAWLE